MTQGSQYDAGFSIDTAINTAQRMIRRDPDLVAATGALSSSFTLAATEFTERAELPFMTFSCSDQICARGFGYVFQTSITCSRMVTRALPIILTVVENATGVRPTKVGIIADNGTSNTGLLKHLQDIKLSLDLTVVADETFTPPLSDATTIVQRMHSMRPEFVLMLSSNVFDTELLLNKFAEYAMYADKLPMVGFSANLGTPALRRLVAPRMLDGLVAGHSAWPGKDQESLVARFVARTGEPWMTKDALMTYADMLILGVR